MEYITPEKLGLKLPRLGFGTMRLPLQTEDDSSSIQMDALQEMVDFAMANGVHYFDTAYMYHQGCSETAMREALKKYPRESYVLVDKMPIWMCDTIEDVDRIFNEQLQKCGTDYFDFYYIHAVDRGKAKKAEELGLYDYLVRQKQAGHIRHIGFSFHDTPAFFKEFMALHPWEVVQVQLNYLDWDLLGGEELYSCAVEMGVALIVMEPVRGGLLARLPEDIAQPLCDAAPEKSQASFALRWLAQHPGVAVVLSGMSNIEQLRENTALFENRAAMSPAELDAVDKTRRLLLERFEIPCTGCNYCMPCPAGVQIPDCFGAYNMFRLYSDEEKYLAHSADALAQGKGAAACVACGQCLEQCPQHIDIPTRMQALCQHEASLR